AGSGRTAAGGSPQAATAQSKAPANRLCGHLQFASPRCAAAPVDLPPGNGRGIHLFQVNRATGVLTPSGVYELETSPSCLALNAAGTRLYSANETGRVDDGKEGTVGACASNRADGQWKLPNTVRA